MVIMRNYPAVRLKAFSYQVPHCGPAGLFRGIPTSSKLGIYHRSFSNVSYKRETLTNKDLGSHTGRRMPDQVPASESHRGTNVSAATTNEDSGHSHNPIWGFRPSPLSRPYLHAQVNWQGSHGPFDAVFLRDCCSCDRCVDPSTTQKTFDTADISPNIQPRSLESKIDGSVRITWEHDLPGFEDHVSVYDTFFCQRNHLLQSRLEATSNQLDQPRIWTSYTTGHKLDVDYDSYMNAPSTLLSSLQHLHLHGILFIRSIPPSSDAVTSIAERIGPLKNTFYGSTWDVRSVPSAKNVAYTSSSLGFHMDLLYVENPPGFQILHCLEASTQGGESLFSDALRVVNKVAKLRPEYYAILENFPVTYKYHNNHEWYQQTRPHIETSFSPHDYTKPSFQRRPDDLLKKPSIKAVNWSPPFQAPFLVNTGGGTFEGPYPYYSQEQNDDVAAFRTYIEAIRFFKKHLETDRAILEKKLEPGTAVIFNNRRIVHARRAFENQAGERWLRGAYIDTDVFRSRLRVLEAESR